MKNKKYTTCVLILMFMLCQVCIGMQPQTPWIGHEFFDEPRGRRLNGAANLGNCTAIGQCSTCGACNSCTSFNRYGTCPSAGYCGNCAPNNCEYQASGFVSKPLIDPDDGSLNWTKGYTYGTIPNPQIVPLFPSDFLQPTFSGGPCVIHCWIQSATDNPYWIDSATQLNSYSGWRQQISYDQTGLLEMNTLDARSISSGSGNSNYNWFIRIITTRPFYLSVVFDCSNSFLNYTRQAYIYVQCTDSSTTITPFLVANQAADPTNWPYRWQQTYDYEINLLSYALLDDPKYVFKDFVLSEPYCPVSERLLDIGPAAMDQRLKPLIRSVSSPSTTQAQDYFMVEADSEWRYIRGRYQYSIRIKTRDSSTYQFNSYTYWGNQYMILNSVCVNISANFTDAYSNMTYNQVYETGADEYWYFRNFTSFTDCPGLYYRVVASTYSGGNALLVRAATTMSAEFKLSTTLQTTINATGPALSIPDAWTVVPHYNNMMYLLPIQPLNNTETVTCFRIEVESFNSYGLPPTYYGYIWRSPIGCVQYKCMKDRFSIVKDPNFLSYKFYYKEPPGTYVTLTFPDFDTTHWRNGHWCFVTDYELDNDSDPNNGIGAILPAGWITWDSPCPNSPRMCRNLKIRIDTPILIQFWVRVTTMDILRGNYPVTINVTCGHESVLKLGSEWLIVFPLATTLSPNYVIWTGSTINGTYLDSTRTGYTLEQIMYSDKYWCDIQYLALFFDANLTQLAYADQNVRLMYPWSRKTAQPSFSYISVNSTTPAYYERYLQATTEGFITGSIKVRIVVCGLETLTRNADLFELPYILNSKGPTKFFSYKYLAGLFNFDKGRGSDQCYNPNINLYISNDVNFQNQTDLNNKTWVMNVSNPTVQLIPDNITSTMLQMKVHDENKFKEMYVFLGMYTWGYKYQYVKFVFEVCGLEHYSVKDELNITYNQFDSDIKGKFYKVIKESEYRANFTSDSRFCPMIFNYSLWMYNSTGKTYIIPNRPGVNFIDKRSNYDLQISTQYPLNTQVYINSTMVYNTIYLKFNIKVLANSIFVDLSNNKPPQFTDPFLNERTFYVSNMNFSESVLEFPLAPYKDDNNQFDLIIFRTTNFGEVNWNNKTETLYRRDGEQNILDYDPYRNVLTFKFSSFQQLHKKANGMNFIEIVLRDLQGLESKLTINARFITYNLPPKFVVNKDGNTIKAWIHNISSHGLLTLKFNESMVSVPLVNQTWLNDVRCFYLNFTGPMNVQLACNNSEPSSMLTKEMACEMTNGTLGPIRTTGPNNSIAWYPLKKYTTSCNVLNSTKGSNKVDMSCKVIVSEAGSVQIWDHIQLSGLKRTFCGNCSLFSTQNKVCNFTSDKKRRLVESSLDLQSIEDMLELELIPYDNWPQYDIQLNITELGFTYTPISFENDTLKVQLTWNNYKMINREVQPDQLFVRFKNRKEWRGLNGSTYLSEDYIALIRNIPTQKDNSAIGKALQQGSNINKLILKLILGFVLVLSLQSKAALHYMLLMISTLQLIIHLPIFSAKFPENVMNYLSDLVPIVMFDLLEDYSATIWSNAQDVVKDKQQLDPQIQTLGYNSHNPLVNFGTITFYIIIYVAKVIFFLAVLVPNKRTKVVKLVFSKVKSQVFFSDFFNIFLECYLEITISCFMVFLASYDTIKDSYRILTNCDKNYVLPPPDDEGKYPINCYNDYWECMSCAIIILIILFLILPGFLIWMLFKKPDELLESKFKQPLGVLYEGIRIKDKSTRLYNLLFVLRRIVYVLIAFNFKGSTGLQIIFLGLCNLFMHIYLFDQKPRSSMTFNRVEQLNEIKYYLEILHMMTFTDWVPHPNLQYNIGWSFIIILTLNILYNMVRILYHLIKDLYLLSQKFKFNLLWYLGFDTVNRSVPTPFKVAKPNLESFMKEKKEPIKPKTIHQSVIVAIDPSTLIWPSQAPKMFGVSVNDKIVDGKWVQDENAPANKKEEEEINLPPEQEFEENDKYYVPSLVLKNGVWSEVNKKLSAPVQATSHLVQGQQNKSLINQVQSKIQNLFAKEPQPQEVEHNNLPEFLKDKSIYQVVSRDNALRELEGENVLFERREYFDPDKFMPNNVVELEPPLPPIQVEIAQKKKEEFKKKQEEALKKQEEQKARSEKNKEIELLPSHDKIKQEMVQSASKPVEPPQFVQQADLPIDFQSSMKREQKEADNFPWQKIANQILNNNRQQPGYAAVKEAYQVKNFTPKFQRNETNLDENAPQKKYYFDTFKDASKFKALEDGATRPKPKKQIQTIIDYNPPVDEFDKKYKGPSDVESQSFGYSLGNVPSRMNSQWSQFRKK